ncbi:MAG: type II secretion system protein [Planctomycetota bacterium]
MCAGCSIPRTCRRRGFTLVELLATIGVIFLIMGLAIVAFSSATRSAQSAADRAAVNGVKLAVEQFQSEFGFLPPLVRDMGVESVTDEPVFPFQRLPSDPIRYVPLVVSPGTDEGVADLRGQDEDTPERYSDYSIAFYLVGALAAEIDGVDGPGFVEVRDDGTFAPTQLYVDAQGNEVEGSARGPDRYASFYDLSRGGVELFVESPSETSLPVGVRAELRDRAGLPIRYYRWLPDGVPFATAVASDPDAYTDDDFGYAAWGAGSSISLSGPLAYYNVPALVLDAFGSPIEDRDGNGTIEAADYADGAYTFPVDLRQARYAVVAAGPNQLFGDEDPDLLSTDDTLRRRYAQRLQLSESRLASDADYRLEALALAREDNVVEVGS